MWLVFLFVHLIGLVGYNLAVRKSLVAKEDKWVLTAVLSTGLSLPLVPFLFFGVIDTSVYTTEIVARLATAIVLEIALQLSIVQALQRLDTGLFSILYNLRVVFATVLGVLFLSEPVVPLRMLGGLLILIGILIVSHKGRKSIDRVGLFWGVTAGVVISLLNFVHKGLIADIGYFNDAVPALMISSLLLWGVALATRRRVNLAHFRKPETIRLMVFRAMSGHGVFLALMAGAVISVANYISSMGVIIIVVLGALLLNERDHLKQKIVATVLAALGLSCILIAQLI